MQYNLYKIIADPPAVAATPAALPAPFATAKQTKPKKQIKTIGLWRFIPNVTFLLLICIDIKFNILWHIVWYGWVAQVHLAHYRASLLEWQQYLSQESSVSLGKDS